MVSRLCVSFLGSMRIVRKVIIIFKNFSSVPIDVIFSYEGSSVISIFNFLLLIT